MPVSRVGQNLPHCGHPNAFALLKKQPLRFAYKSTFPHFPSASSCRAAVNNASGVIALILFPKPRIYKADNEVIPINHAPLLKVNHFDHPFPIAGSQILWI
jgi:hypothetical protein